MARLTEPQKIFIIQRLACFETPIDIIKALKEDYGVAVSAQALQGYDPTKYNGQNLSKKLRTAFEETRARFLDDIGSIAIANKAVRLRMLERMAVRAYDKGNSPLAAQLLEQAAKEVGEAYTNRQRLEHTGKDGQPIAVESKVSAYSDSELEKRIRELEGKTRGKG